MYLPKREGDKHLTLTAKVTHRFNTEAAIFGPYHYSAGMGERHKRIIPKMTHLRRTCILVKIHE